MKMVGHRPLRVHGWFRPFLLSCILAVLCLAGGSLARAEDGTTVYSGTFGKSDVVVELKASGEDVWGRYFYRRHRFDIPLSGAWKDGQLLLQAPNTDGTLTLRKDGKGLSGELVTRTKKRLAATLKPVEANIVPVLPNLELYDALQLDGLKLQRGKAFRQDGRDLRTYREPVSGMSLFRIESGYPVDALGRLNANLERQHWAEVSAWFSCTGFDGGTGMDISEVRAIWLSGDFVSYAWNSSWSCAGAAHPDFGVQGHTYDVRTGRELDLDDVLHFGDAPVPAPDSDAFYTYRSDVFGPAIVKLMRRLHPGEMPAEGARPSEDSDECDYGDPDVWDFPSWYLTKDGLYLSAIFPRVNRACDSPDWSVIPWSAITLTPTNTGISVENGGSSLWFGNQAFVAEDVKSLTIDFDAGGFAVLDIALRGPAISRLTAETLRLQNTDIAIKLGEDTLTTARLVEQITDGRFRIGGRFTVQELNVMARNITRTLGLPKSALVSPAN